MSLVASAAPGSTFAGWSAPCGLEPTCLITLENASSVTATFGRIPHKLTVATIGQGLGSVVSSPNGIACGSTCLASFDAGTGPILHAIRKR